MENAEVYSNVQVIIKSNRGRYFLSEATIRSRDYRRLDKHWNSFAQLLDEFAPPPIANSPSQVLNSGVLALNEYLNE